MRRRVSIRRLGTQALKCSVSSVFWGRVGVGEGTPLTQRVRPSVSRDKLELMVFVVQDDLKPKLSGTELLFI